MCTCQISLQKEDEATSQKIFQERIFHKMKKHKHEMRELKKQVTNIEELLDQLVNKKHKRRSDKRGTSSFATLEGAEKTEEV